jgi:hypothetical protein
MDASRLIDDFCGRWFYAYTGTRYFSLPDDDTIWFDADLLTVTSLTNGDGTAIAAANFNLLPKNSSPKYALKTKPTANVIWTTDSSGESEFVLSIAGTWGFVDRSATDPVSARWIRVTRQACIDIVAMRYDQRFGVNTQGVATVTPAGVVITPQGAIPRSAYEALKPLIRVV